MVKPCLKEDGMNILSVKMLAAPVWNDGKKFIIIGKSGGRSIKTTKYITEGHYTSRNQPGSIFYDPGFSAKLRLAADMFERVAHALYISYVIINNHNHK
jgi:hypothetical protein